MEGSCEILMRENEKKIAPCKNCANREVGCHSLCNDYKIFRENLDKVNENRRKYLESIDYDRI